MASLRSRTLWTAQACTGLFASCKCTAPSPPRVVEMRLSLGSRVDSDRFAQQHPPRHRLGTAAPQGKAGFLALKTPPFFPETCRLSFLLCPGHRAEARLRGAAGGGGESITVHAAVADCAPTEWPDSPRIVIKPGGGSGGARAGCELLPAAAIDPRRRRRRGGVDWQQPSDTMALITSDCDLMESPPRGWP